MGILAVKVQKRHGERVRSILYQNQLLNRAYQIVDRGDYLEIPLIESIPEPIKKELEDFSIETITQTDPKSRRIPLEPFEMVEKQCNLPEELKGRLPRKWELIGDVLVLKFPEELREYRGDLAEVYAEVLGARTVLEERSGISGETRKPDMEVILGSETETVHVENSIKYKLDTKQLMFSSGNISERLRMAELDCQNETIVDMFAGIGYFSLPLVLYTGPKQVVACELNPVSFGYLKENIALNGVGDIMKPLLGDCRKTAPEGSADRIVMGFLKQSESHLEKAFSVLSPSGGIIHYHQVCPNEDIPKAPLNRLKDAGSTAGFKLELLFHDKIKSYAPGISHAVLDVRAYR